MHERTLEQSSGGPLPAPLAGTPLDAASDCGAIGGAAPLNSSRWRHPSVCDIMDSDTYPGMPRASAPCDAYTGGAGQAGQVSPAATWADALAEGSRQPHSLQYSPLQQSESPQRPTGTEPAIAKQLWSPSKRPQVPMAAAALGSPLGGGGGAVPPGVDAASYAAGERAALMLAFQQALPGQQALGQLFSAVDSLHGRLEEEAAQWRQLQLGSATTAGVLEAAVQRLDALELVRLPQVQKQVAAAARPPEQLLELLSGLQQALGLLAEQRHMLAQQAAAAAQQAAAAAAQPPRPRATSSLHWLLLAAAGYGQSVLSRADVAALFLSRRILLVPASQPRPGGSEGAWDATRRQLSTALSALLFVASVEAAWQAQRRLLRPLPAAARSAAAPLRLGLRVTRAAVWAAAVVLAVAQARASCHAAGEHIGGAAAAAAGYMAGASAVLPTLPASGRRLWPLWRLESRHAESAVAAGCAALPEETAGLPVSSPEENGQATADGSAADGLEGAGSDGGNAAAPEAVAA